MSEIFNLKKKLKSIKSIAKASQALQIITTAKIRGMQTLFKNFQEYKKQLAEILSLVPEAYLKQKSTPPSPACTTTLLVIAGNRGFCGAFNQNVIQKTEQLAKSLQTDGQKINLYLIGKKAYQHFKNRPYEIIGLDLKLVENPDAKSTLRLSSYFLSQLAKGSIKNVYLVYNEFESILMQHPATAAFLPFTHEEIKPSPRTDAFIFEPEKNRVAEEVFLHYLSAFLLSKVIGSVVGELGARLLITKNAVDTSHEMIDELVLHINKTRQAQITGELSEIISSFNVLKEAEA